MNRSTRWLLVAAFLMLAGSRLLLGVLANRAQVASVTPSTVPASTGPSPSASGGVVDPDNPWLSADAVAYAVQLRKSIGLRSDGDWVRFVATVPSAVDNVVRYSIPMTAAEVLDAGNLNANRDRILADLAQFGADHVTAWGGYYLDGGLITVMLIDPSGTVERDLRASIPPPLAVKPARWSFETLTDLSLVVAGDSWLQAHNHVLSAGADVEQNAVALEVASTDPTAVARIKSHFNLGDELLVTIGDPNQGPPDG
jgi:hypothetical protein